MFWVLQVLIFTILACIVALAAPSADLLSPPIFAGLFIAAIFLALAFRRGV